VIILIIDIPIIPNVSAEIQVGMEVGRFVIITIV